MTIEKLEKFLDEGEGYTLEYKESVNSLSDSVFETVSSQIEICCGRIYDRNGDADQDVTTSADLVANISNRKSAVYIERKIFPYATEEDLCMELVGKARQMAVNKFKDHPWGAMTDMELLRSAGYMKKIWKVAKKALTWRVFFCLESRRPFNPVYQATKPMQFTV